MPERFLVCVDSSPLTGKTLDRACKLAQAGQATLDLLNVVPLVRGSAKGNMAARQILDQAQRAAHDRARAEVQAWMDKVPEPLRGAIVIKDGIPADVITELAGSGYDMVVLSTHGRTGFSHALLGSVAERVVRASPIPVLVVR
jgi:universal stress protein A